MERPVRFASSSALFALACLLLGCGADQTGYRSAWSGAVDRVWVGPGLWANRLQDWRIAGGRLECLEDGPRMPLRTVHLLSHRIGSPRGDLHFRIHTGPVADALLDSTAAAGFLIGAGGAMDYRSAALIQSAPGEGAGLFAGIRADGSLFLADLNRGFEPLVVSDQAIAFDRPFTLEVDLEPNGFDVYAFEMRAENDDGPSATLSLEAIPEDLLEGNVALVAHRSRRWFETWRVDGSKLVACDGCDAGPILSTQYTLSRGVMKLTAQMMPIGAQDNQKVLLQTWREDDWQPTAEAEIVVPGWTATFRVEPWESDVDVPYRVVYEMRTAPDEIVRTQWSGTVRRDPVDKPIISVAGFTGNHNVGHGFGRAPYDFTNRIWFPHRDIVEAVSKQDVDLLFFSGDQVYEGDSPTPADLSGGMSSYLDYLYKWALWAWAFRDLTRDRPTITIPDDHDVYQGNIWGQSGRPTDVDNKGGYVMPADWVRMVERTQTSHLPDPYDPTPIDQGIGVYYTHLTYGRIGIAVLEDRKFKSGCADLIPGKEGRPDHVLDPSFNPRVLDQPGLELLGPRQEKFLAEWTADWSGQDMKLAVMQTVFAGVATHHGASLDRIYSDLDSNGWPQSGRNRALSLLRRGFVFMMGGDQHLSSILHHGIDAFNDAGFSFTAPSIANFYPRGWLPEAPGLNRPEGAPSNLGEHLDGLGNRVTVFGVTNPTSLTGISTGQEPLELHDNMPGYGILRFDKLNRTITMENWPRYVKPDNPASGGQYEGWPMTVSQRDNYGRRPSAFLPVIRSDGWENPVVRIWDGDGQLVYAIRIQGAVFQPGVFGPGPYTVEVGDPDTGGFVRLENQMAAASRRDTVEISASAQP